MFCAVFYTFGSVFVLIICSPWGGETRLVATVTERCAMIETCGYLVTSFNILSDIYLVVIPIPVVMKLQMSTERKLRVCSIFMLGIL